MSGLFRRALATLVALSFLLAQGGNSAAEPRAAYVAHGFSVPAELASAANGWMLTELLARIGPPRAVLAATAPQRVPVKEPPRVRPSPPALSSLRPKVHPAVRVLNGRHAAGWPMLRPVEIDRALKAAARRRAPASTFTAPTGGTARRVTRPGVQLAPPGSRRAQSLPSDANASGTGINPWWRYQSESIPGGGRVMVNVGTGNLLLQDDDMSVPHKGIEMAFRRTYNSQSQHDVNATDATGFKYVPPGMYGNGWTNTFDAHMAVNADVSVYSIFDIDGARYDYDATWPPDQPNGVFAPRAGNHATLTSDGYCGFLWTKKSGTTYYFYRPGPHAPASCGQTTISTEGYAGRLWQIIGRNRNTYLSFTYSWDDGQASLTGKISEISVQTESGMTTTLSFADVNGHRLLQQLTMPDGVTTVSYGYDSLGNLTTVSRPPNNASGIRPLIGFGYQGIGSASVLQWVASPRWMACTGGCGYDGGYLYFLFSGSSATASTLNSINHGAVVNPPIPDGTNTPLQPGYVPQAGNYSNYLIEYYTTGVATPTLRDSDGHMTNWVVDGTGRPTQTQECTQSASQGQQCTGTWLVTNESWDSNNNLTAETDPRGYETDYAFDANGNTIAVAEPQATTTAGTFRPTQLFDYDSGNNVVAFCDEKASHAGGHDWSGGGPPTAGGPDALCATNGGPHVVITYTPTSSEPSGELTGIRTPLGYSRTIRYDPAAQGGMDFGLPTSVAGDQIAQSDGTRTPLTTMAYDTNGNVTCSASDGNAFNTTTLVTYDALNRVIAVADPDDASTSNAACSKTADIAGSSVVTRTWYFPNGQASTTQTPAEAAASVSTQFQYDLDGNVTSEQRHNTTGAGPTLKWYDGADRLVEVQQPTDPSDFYCFPWRTRYVYDLTGDGTVTFASSSSFHAYGGLYKTQEYLPGGTTTATWNEGGPSSGTCNGVWQDTSGTAFDAFDRPLIAYRNTGTGLMAVTTTYDSNGAFGRLSQKCNAVNECQSYAYDARGTKIQTTFNVGTSTTQAFSYDEDGRLANATNGVGSVSDVYDADGRKVTRAENVGTVTTGITYAYYGDGARRSVDISAGAQSLPGILAYTYRNDGLLRRLSVGGSQSFSFSYTGGGRLTSRSDSTGQPASTFTYTGGGSPSSYGLVQSLTSPAYNESGMTYNAEGLQMSEANAQWWNGSGWYPAAFSGGAYTSRGELIASFPSPCCTGTLFANGTRVKTARSTTAATPYTASFSFNVLQGMTVGSSSPNTCVRCETGDNHTNSSFTYDAAGRQTLTTIADDGFYPDVKTYDAEDHLVAQVAHTGRFSQAQQLGYRWGPVGHPLQIGSTSVGSPDVPPTDFQYDTLGWDDDTLLFTVNPAGQIDDVKVGDFADYVPGAANALSVWDRDVNGQAISCHNSFGPASVNFYPATEPLFIPCNWNGFANVSFKPAHLGSTTAIGHGGMLAVAKGDGFSDGVNIFQGVRTYDFQAGQWTTPDAYHGSVHDPMSQKPYMWNRNNPYAYSDPSGYDPIDWVCPMCSGARTAYNDVKSDVQTLASPRASTLQKGLAVVGLASWVALPAKAPALAIRAIRIVQLGGKDVQKFRTVAIIRGVTKAGETKTIVSSSYPLTRTQREAVTKAFGEDVIMAQGERKSAKSPFGMHAEEAALWVADDLGITPTEFLDVSRGVCAACNDMLQQSSLFVNLTPAKHI